MTTNDDVKTKRLRGSKAIDHLEALRPEGPWVLTAIIPDPKPGPGRRTFTETFSD